jgi:hypothetical protein
MTEKEALALYATGWWEHATPADIAAFQLQEKMLTCPFDVFHRSVEKTLGRPVWTHEFAFPDHLIAELHDEREPPTMKEILELIPVEKRLVVEVG